MYSRNSGKDTADSRSNTHSGKEGNEGEEEEYCACCFVQPVG